MTQSNAEKVANLVIGAAAAGAAFYILKTPSLRRVAWQLAVTGLTGGLPAWFRREIEQGWRESGHMPGDARTSQHAEPAPAV